MSCPVKLYNHPISELMEIFPFPVGTKLFITEITGQKQKRSKHELPLVITISTE